MAILSPGAVDYHLVNSTGTLSINSLSNCSIVCWLNTAWNSGTTQSMVGLYPSATSVATAIQIGVRDTTGAVVVWASGGGHLVDNINAAGGLLVTLTNNTWHHIGYTFDGTFHRLYIDGILINQVNNSTGTSVTTGRTGYFTQASGTLTTVYINGYASGGAGETSIFSFSDISHFNRTLLANEIQTMYVCAGARDGIVYGNISSYLCNEGTPGSTVSTIIDESGGNNTLSVTGTATGVNFSYVADTLNGDVRLPL